MLKKLVAGLYVDRISFSPLNEYLKIGTFFLIFYITLFPLSNYQDYYKDRGIIIKSLSRDVLILCVW